METTQHTDAVASRVRSVAAEIRTSLVSLSPLLNRLADLPALAPAEADGLVSQFQAEVVHLDEVVARLSAQVRPARLAAD